VAALPATPYRDVAGKRATEKLKTTTKLKKGLKNFTN